MNFPEEILNSDGPIRGKDGCEKLKFCKDSKLMTFNSKIILMISCNVEHRTNENKRTPVGIMWN